MDTTNLKQALLTEEKRLREDLSSIARHDPSTGDWVAIPDADELRETDENNEADGVETWNERRATVAQLEMSHKNVCGALAKIETGAYGTCELCSEAIEPERLIANPAARTCVTHRDQERELSL